jgi:hypothetical protein
MLRISGGGGGGGSGGGTDNAVGVSGVGWAVAFCYLLLLSEVLGPE